MRKVKNVFYFREIKPFKLKTFLAKIDRKLFLFQKYKKNKSWIHMVIKNSLQFF